MLRQRVVTGVCMVAVLAAVLFLLPAIYFKLALLVIFTLAAWEWANLAGYHEGMQRVAYAGVAGLVFSGVLWVGMHAPTLVQGVLGLALAGWAIALLAVVRYPASRGLWASRPRLALVGIWLLLPCFCSVLLLKQSRLDGLLVLLVIASIAAADIGAYFAGRRFGRHKLAPAVSPGKTWEGVWGGMAANLLLALLASRVPGLTPLPMAGLVLLLLATGAISILGDLFESMVKRERGVKDSSQLLPGHGGILDRIDGWTAAFPLFTFFYLTWASHG